MVPDRKSEPQAGVRAPRLADCTMGAASGEMEALQKGNQLVRLDGINESAENMPPLFRWTGCEPLQ